MTTLPRFGWLRAATVSILLLGGFAVPTLNADEAPSAVGPLMKLLQSGRVPPERLDTVVELVCRRGNEHDLAYVYQQAISPTGYKGPLQRAALKGLADAAQTRKVKPAGDLSKIGELIQPAAPKTDAALQLTVIELAGLWNVPAVVPQLTQLALDKKTPPKLWDAAMTALGSLDKKQARWAVAELTSADRPQRVRYQAVAHWSRLNLEEAASEAAKVLKEADAQTDPAPLMKAFLDRQGGTELLASAISKQAISPDVAKRALRAMFAAGRNDPALADSLSQAAGIGGETKPLSKAEIQQLGADVLSRGDAVRGEQIFRRADLSCMKCHAVSKAGGDVGPDLSPVGQSSPVDYLVNSILDPNQAVKEEFATQVVLTSEGKVLHGIVVNQDDDRLVLKDATGKQEMISKADVEDQREGKSLMPQGLTKFLTRAELIDLVRFLSELGKPGPYAVRTTNRMQRWRFLQLPQDVSTSAVPVEDVFREHVQTAEPADWQAAYGQVGGLLPLSELTDGKAQGVVWVKGEIEVTVPGQLQVELNSAEATEIWMDDQPIGNKNPFPVELSRGRHAVILRIDLGRRQESNLKLELSSVPGSKAEFAVVDGQ